MASPVRTRFLIVSDTHGDELLHNTSERVDVAIHCGDFTEESKLDEFRAAVQLLKQLNAPLKLVIAGNHEFTMDSAMFKKKLDEFNPSAEDKLLVDREFGAFGQARQILESKEAKDAGIVFLDEGIHHFDLANGAKLSVYASPFTPSPHDWGFVFDPRDDHAWQLDDSVDVAITHGPPKGILDRADRQHVGSKSLFEAIARARPRVHCFGHIHQGWGARRVTWRSEEADGQLSHLNAFEENEVMESISKLRTTTSDSDEVVNEVRSRREKYNSQGYCAVTEPVAAVDRNRAGAQTLFVNAAIQGPEDGVQQWPWIVDVELPRQGKGEDTEGECEVRRA